jgi:hypothetical protein
VEEQLGVQRERLRLERVEELLIGREDAVVLERVGPTLSTSQRMCVGVRDNAGSMMRLLVFDATSAALRRQPCRDR